MFHGCGTHDVPRILSCSRILNTTVPGRGDGLESCFKTQNFFPDDPNSSVPAKCSWHENCTPSNQSTCLNRCSWSLNCSAASGLWYLAAESPLQCHCCDGRWTTPNSTHPKCYKSLSPEKKGLNESITACKEMGQAVVAKPLFNEDHWFIQNLTGKRHPRRSFSQIF